VKVRDVMTSEVATVPFGTTLKEVARILAERRISGVPVVDESGAVLGVVSEADIVRVEAGEEARGGLLAGLLADRRPARLEACTAADAMTSPAVTARPEQDVAEAARLMTEREVNRLPVVERDGSLVGIVTRADLVRAFVRSDEEIERELRDDVILGVMWIDPSTLEVTASGGEVTVEGEVPSRQDAELLEQFASRVPGVVSVRARLRWRLDGPRLPRPRQRVPRAPRDR
jgi:CBS-domain-containing membrane protein